MTKSERDILKRVKEVNSRGGLCGLGSGSPQDPNFQKHEWRFVKRLYDAGKIVWVPWSGSLGAGWAVPEAEDLIKAAMSDPSYGRNS